jgi:hypothetical protein
MTDAHLPSRNFNRMADWRARIDALKAEAAARHVPIAMR